MFKMEDDIPEWLRFGMDLGHSIVQTTESISDPKMRLFAIVLVPIRTMMATMIATGLVKGRISTPVSVEEHFSFLCNLTQGTYLHYIDDKNYTERVEVIGRQVVTDGVNKGKSLFYVQSCDGKVKKNIVESTAFRYVPSTEAITFTKRKKIDIPKTLDFLSPQRRLNFILESRLDCLIIGSKKIINQEIQEGRYLINGQIISLEDLLRPKKEGGLGYRSQIEGVFSRNLNYPKAYVTIYDGVSAFLKHREYSKNSHQVLVLERTDPRLEEAQEVIRYLYYDRSEVNLSHNLNVPDGAQVLIFGENK